MEINYRLFQIILINLFFKYSKFYKKMENVQIINDKKYNKYYIYK